VRRQIALFLAIALVLAGGFFFVALKPRSADISEVRRKVTTRRQEAADLRVRLAQLNAAKGEAPASLAKLTELNLMLPPTPDLPVFIRQVQLAANAAGVDLLSIAPSPPALVEGSGGLAIISVNLQVTGGYFRIESFLARLESLSRALEVQSVGLSASVDPATGLATLSSTITLRMYQAPPGARLVRATSSPRPSPSPSPGAGR
jgi:Tfp pilus assembly protein PilO